MTSPRLAGLLAILCSVLIACSERRLSDAVAGAGGDGSQMLDAASSGTGGTPAGGAGGTSGAGGAGGVYASDTGGSDASGAGGAHASDAGGSDAGDPDASTGEPDVECTTAYRLDTCCYDAVAVTRDQLRADPCLFEYPGVNIDIDTFESCKPDDCAAVSCEWRRPPSYVVARNANGCAFADECTQPSDCVLATESGICCMCPQGMPASVALNEACYLSEREARESTASCPFGCFNDGSSEPCEACPEPAAPTCLIRDSFNICQ